MFKGMDKRVVDDALNEIGARGISVAYAGAIVARGNLTGDNYYCQKAFVIREIVRFMSGVR